MAEQHLTKSELAIMEVMWEQEEALTASEIIKASGDKEWKNSSIHLMVNALLEKGFLEVAGFKKTTKNYARTFKPTMTKEKYFVRKVMGNTPVAEKKKIYMQRTLKPMMWKLGRLMHLQRDRDAENRTERRLSSGPRRAV